MGYEFNSSAIPDIGLVDFTGDTVKVYSYGFVNDIYVGRGASFICDEEGELALLTNNCAVYDADFFLVPGSDSLTPGWGYDVYCGFQGDGEYIGRQLTAFLPQIGNDSITYLIHKDNILHATLPEVLSTKLYLSTIIRKIDGTYYLKEKRQLLDGQYNYGRLTACLHADGDKWWTSMTEHNSNKFDWFLVGGQDTVQGPFVQTIGPPQINTDQDISQIVFSPDATKLAINYKTPKRVHLYDFNNATGEMSNPQTIPYPGDIDAAALGVAFSLDSRFIYANTNNDLFQIDLWDNNSVEHIAHHASLDEDNWPVNMGNITLGPDCRMYISPGSTTYYLHVVHHPNQKGAACGFEARALRSPANISIDVPNIPMYRFGGACDSTIAFPYKDTVSTVVARHEFGNKSVMVFPNPVKDYFTVAFPDQVLGQARLLLFDGLGRLVLERPLPALSNVFDADGLGPGLYFYEVRDEGRLLGSGKLVRVE